MCAAPLPSWAKQGDGLHVLAHNACHQIGSQRNCWRHSERLGRRRIGLYQVTSGIEVMASSLAPARRLHSAQPRRLHSAQPHGPLLAGQAIPSR